MVGLTAAGTGTLAGTGHGRDVSDGTETSRRTAGHGSGHAIGAGSRELTGSGAVDGGMSNMCGHGEGQAGGFGHIQYDGGGNGQSIREVLGGYGWGGGECGRVVN